MANARDVSCSQFQQNFVTSWVYFTSFVCSTYLQSRDICSSITFSHFLTINPFTGSFFNQRTKPKLTGLPRLHGYSCYSFLHASKAGVFEGKVKWVNRRDPIYCVKPTQFLTGHWGHSCDVINICGQYDWSERVRVVHTEPVSILGLLRVFDVPAKLIQPSLHNRDGPGLRQGFSLTYS